MYSHASTTKQVHMMMNSFQVQTNMVGSANHYGTSYYGNVSNTQQGASYFNPSATNSQYVAEKNVGE